MADKPSDRPLRTINVPYRPSGRPITVVPVYGAPSQPRQPPFVRNVEPLAPTAAQAVREHIDRLVALRLAPTITATADRAELDSIIGALTVAVSA